MVFRLIPALCLCGLISATSLSCRPPASRDILYVALSGSSADTTTVVDIWAMSRNGEQKRQLTHNTVAGRQCNFPAWSPDGSIIAFVAGGSGERYLLNMMEASGDSVREIVRLDSLDVSYPEWSPDGSRLVFIASAPTDGTSWVYTVNRDGSMVRKVSESG